MDAVHITMSATRDSLPKPRATYRHGDLRRALLDAGIALARDGGPDAVVLREATRRAGVVPNAAYRHFASRDELLGAVRLAALQALAMAMETELAKQRRFRSAADAARASLIGVGAGYLRFAQEQTGLFRTAFGGQFAVRDQPDPAKSGASGMDPFQLLGHALDQLVVAGVLPAERRPGAEWLAWSAVHGMALLLIDGPMRGMPPAQVQPLARRLLEMVEKGL
jgi:AcrR family transcriptional regulator